MTLKLIKYPGSKTALLPEIKRIFLKSNSYSLVDAFGGSGTVSLNTDAKLNVYNDLNREVYNLFSVIQKQPDDLLKLMLRWTSDRSQFLKYEELDRDKKLARIDNVDRAFGTFYKFNVGFGGMGSTYRTRREKSSYSQMVKIVSNYEIIRSKVSNWKIECVDFRELVDRFDDGRTFFYFDPPYLGKNWYGFPFAPQDLKDVKQITEDTGSKFLVSLDYNDKPAIEIFGEPNVTLEYENQNRKRAEPTSYRKLSLYTNVK